MKILYDGQIYSHDIIGGVCRYFNNVISRLPESYEPVLMLDKVRVLRYPTHPNLKVRAYKRFRLPPFRVAYWLDKYYFNPFIRPDIIHPTYYMLLNHQQMQNYDCPIVLTVYDMIYERFPEQFTNAESQIAAKKKAIMAAQQIICISQHTKQDLLEHYHIPEQNVNVIYLASAFDGPLSKSPGVIPCRPYYLYIGSRVKHKNFDGLLTAFSNMISVRPEIGLCIVGYPFTEAEKRLISACHLEDHIEYCGYVGDDYLAKLYKNSIALVYPSFYEGFGIPPLEAMVCGTAVIAANTSSIPEVVGDAGLLFQPEKIDELTDILLWLIDNPTEREMLIAKGYQRARLFSWEKTVQQTLNVYRSVSKQ